MEKEYGYEKCPLDEDKPCFDFDRLGTIACGLCGDNTELTKQGQENFLRGLNQLMKDNESIK